MTEGEQVELLCQRLGAAPAQARAMANQLLKRCDQLVVERGISRTEAMAYLLQLVVQGRSGEAPPGFSGITSPPDTAPGAVPPETR